MLFRRQLKLSRLRKSLSLHTRIVLDMTLLLIFATAALLFLLEWDNPGTLASFNWWEKGMNALFESVTLRTAGFAGVNYGA